MDPEWTDGFKPCAQDPTRRTCAVCKWQRFVATFLIACRRMSLNYIANLDEEAIDLLAYQRQFQAAARFVSIIDETMQSLMSIV